MSDNKQASNAILKGIKHLIDKEIENLPIDKTFTGLIKEVKEDNLYDVLIQGKVYTNIPSIFNGLKINETVKIKVPQNQYSQMYIEGKYNMKTDVPETLPNPFSLIFNGAVNAEYDGSKEITVTIPSGGEAGTSNYNDLINKPTSLPANGGNADTATKLQTARKIAGTSFDGTQDISISYNNLTDKPTIPSGVQVIDNLTSSSTTASLSANQGRILKGDIDKKVVVSSTQPSGQQTGDTWYQII